MRVLLDLDGVVADWTKAVAAVTEKYGHKLDTTSWFQRKDLPEGIRDRVMSEIAAPDFNLKFEVLAGAKEAVSALRAAGHEVHFVTSLWDCPTWVYDRNRWLRKHGFCAAPSGVTYTKDKYVVSGQIFVDDKVSNVLKWRDKWEGRGVGVVWAQPWNAEYTGPNRFNDWERILRMADGLRGWK